MKRKKLIATTILSAALFGILTPSTFAAKQETYFSLNPDRNSGIAYSAPNPKDDNEQNAYIYTTNHNIVADDLFFYNVRKSASTSALSYTGYIKVTPSNAARIVRSYSTYASKGTSLVLQADTDRHILLAEGYWYS